MHTTDCNCGDGDTKRVQDRHIDFHGGAQEMQKFHILLFWTQLYISMVGTYAVKV